MLEVEEQLRRYGAALENELLQGAESSVVTTPVPSRSRGRRHASLLVAGSAVIVIALVVALLVGVRGDRDRSQIESQPAPRGVFSETTNAVLLMSDGIDGVTAIDLDGRIAARTVIDGERAGDQPFRITTTGGHVVVGWAEIYAQPLSGEESTKIDDATIYVPAAEPAAVWTISWEGERIGVGAATVRRVSMNGTVELSSNSLDTNVAQPLLGVPGGLVVQTPEGVAVWDSRTETVGPTLGPGQAFSVASNGELLAWCENTCADVHVVALADQGPPTARHAAPGGQQLALSNDGRWLALLRPGPANGNEVVIRNLGDGTESIVATGLTGYGSVAWSPDSRQLFYSEDSYLQESMRLGRFGIDDGLWEEKEIPVGDAVGGLVVLSPTDARGFFSVELVEPEACPGAGGEHPSGRGRTCSFRF